MNASSISRKVEQSMVRRRKAEKRFRLISQAAVLSGLLFVLFLFVTIISNGIGAFWQNNIRLDINLEPTVLLEDPPTSHAISAEQLEKANYDGLIRSSLRQLFPEVTSHRDKKALYALVSQGAGFKLRNLVLESPDLVGKTLSLWVPLDDKVDTYLKHAEDAESEGELRQLSTQQLEWITRLTESNRIESHFYLDFFFKGDSRDPELAGIGGAIKGSLLTLLVTLLLSFPISVAAAVYLEEFAPRNRITDLIEVNINNLAAVPSIVFGLLGLAVFINFFGVPRSASLVGGFVLTLMTLPTIIIAGRAALKSVPPSIREAALGIGASPMQTVVFHVLPLALPGMLTGTIIGMAQALGESAPLLMIGMVAFIVDVPDAILDPATVLPVQIYLWSDSPERAFLEKTSAAIMVLLSFLIVMNLLAVVIRKKFERRW